MKEQDFVNAIKHIRVDSALEDKIIAKCKALKPPKKVTSFRRPILTAAACIVAITLVVAGIPLIQHNNYTGETGITWIDTLSFKVKAGNLGIVELEEGVETLIPNTKNFVINQKLIDGEKVNIVVGMTAPDFIITGKNVESVTYTAEKGVLYSEFDSHDHDQYGNFVWSRSFALAPLQEYGSWCRDIDAPTKAELVAILNDLHSKQALTAFYNTIYTAELRDMEGKTGREWEEAYAAFQEKCAMPIDFNQYTLSAKVDDDSLEITIINPSHPPVEPVEAKSITVSANDTVSWYIAEESSFGQKIFGQRESDVDFSRISDKVEVVIKYKNGTTKVCTLNLQYSSDGELGIRLSV